MPVRASGNCARCCLRRVPEAMPTVRASHFELYMLVWNAGVSCVVTHCAWPIRPLIVLPFFHGIMAGCTRAGEL